MPAEPSQFHLSIRSEFSNIDLVQIVLNESMEKLGVEEDARHWVELAVREAVANAIKHGNLQDPAKSVSIDGEIDGETLVIHVRDEGPGFDLDQLDDPLSPENLMRPNGRGIFYMRKFMDSIEFSSHPEGGTVVTLRKHLVPPASSDETQEEQHT